MKWRSIILKKLTRTSLGGIATGKTKMSSIMPAKMKKIIMNKYTSSVNEDAQK